MRSIYKSNLFGMFLIITWILGSIAYQFINEIFLKNNTLIFSLIVPQILFILVPIMLFIKMNYYSFKETLRLNKINFTSVLLVVLISVFIRPLLNLIAYIGQQFFQNPLEGMTETFSSMNFFVLFFAVAIVPGVLEELAMRGVIQSGYKGVDIKITAIINGLFFGMLHLNFHQFIYAFVIGVLLVFLVEITDSIYASIISHITINGSMVVLLEVSKLFPPNDSQEAIDQLASLGGEANMLIMVFLIISALICTPIAFVFIYLLCKTNKKEKVVNLKEWSIPPKFTRKLVPFYITCGLFLTFSILIEIASKMTPNVPK